MVLVVVEVVVAIRYPYMDLDQLRGDLRV